MFWPSRNLHWTLNQAGSLDLPVVDAQEALERSFRAWADISCSDITFTYDGLTARSDLGFDPTASDNLNLLAWRERNCGVAVPLNDPCVAEVAEHPFACANKYNCWSHSSGIIALTTVTYNVKVGNMVDADIEFNGSPDAAGNEFRFTASVADGPPCAGPTDPNCVATDVQNTATHEVGHFLGLAHTAVFDATMFASAPLGETKKRTLDPDDEEGLCSIYPAGRPPTTCTPSGNITIAPQPKTGCGCGGSASIFTTAGLLAGLLRRRRRRECV